MTGTARVPITVEECAADERPDWEVFVARAAGGTLFHRRAFLDYHPPGRFTFRHLVFRKEGRIVAVMPGALLSSGEAAVFRSPAGGSFGGPALEMDFDRDTAREVVDALVDMARAERWPAVEIAPPPEIYWHGRWHDFVPALIAAGFAAVATDVTQIVPLQENEEALWDALDRQARKAIRKSRREGVAVEESRDWDAFHPVLLADRARNGVTPTHNLEELRRLDGLVGEALGLFLASKDGSLVGGTLMFQASPEVALNFYLCHRDDVQADRPSDALAWASILWAKARGCRWYDFGTSSVAGVVNPGLWRFKSKFGAVDYPRSRYRWERAGS